MISDELAASLSDTQMSQGIFAICRMPKSDNAAQYAEMKSGGKYIILDNIQDPGNMGTMLRTADACGIDAIITCNCCDVYNPKTVRSAMGSLMRVNIIDDDIYNAVLNLKKRVLQFMRLLSTAAPFLSQNAIFQRAAQL